MEHETLITKKRTFDGRINVLFFVCFSFKGECNSSHHFRNSRVYDEKPKLQENIYCTTTSPGSGLILASGSV